jgi:hypothetical protein
MAQTASHWAYGNTVVTCPWGRKTRHSAAAVAPVYIPSSLNGVIAQRPEIESDATTNIPIQLK